MPTVAVVEGVSIVFYMNEHPPAQFHAKYAEHRAIIAVDTLDVLEGHLPKAEERVVRTWAESRRDAMSIAVAAGAHQMNELPRIASAEAVIHGVLKIVFLDGYQAVVDLRPVIAKGRIFTWLQSQEHFSAVRVGDYGHDVYWTDGDGDIIDLSADSLRRDAEKQAELHRLIAI